MVLTSPPRALESSPVGPPEPTARYDERGNLYVSFPPNLTESPVFPLMRHTLTVCLPMSSFEWEPTGDTLFVEWKSARVVERTLHDMWPSVEISAAANPAYRGTKAGPRAGAVAQRALVEAGR